MTSDNPLQPVYHAFVVAKECIDGARRSIHDQNEALSRHMRLITGATTDAESALEEALRQAAELAVLALFATFERLIIEQLQAAQARLANGHPAGYSARLGEKYSKDVEHWRFHDMLDLFKTEIDERLIGQAKQIKQYRDWIAHRNPDKRVPLQTTPAAAFSVLTRLLQRIRHVHAMPENVDTRFESAPLV